MLEKLTLLIFPMEVTASRDDEVDLEMEDVYAGFDAH
jgi:hypothetical protein